MSDVILGVSWKFIYNMNQKLYGAQKYYLNERLPLKLLPWQNINWV